MPFVIVNIDKRKPLPAMYGPYRTLKEAQCIRDTVPTGYSASLVCLSVRNIDELFAEINRRQRTAE